MKKLKNKAHCIGVFCGLFASAMLLLMMLLMVADIVLRFLFNRPILGGYEMVEMLMVLVVGFGFAFTQASDGHVRVTMLLDHLSVRLRAAIDAWGLLAGAAMMAIVAVAGLVQGGAAAEQSQTTMVLMFPTYPFYYLLGLGFFLYAVIMVADALFEINIAIRPASEKPDFIKKA